MASDTLASVAGPTGVGALCVLGIFLFLDGRAPDLFPTVETYAKTATWGIVAAVPLVVITYVIGLFLIAGMQIAVGLAFDLGFARDAADLVRLSSVTADKSAAVQVYLQLMQDRGVLAGSSFALLILFAGALSEIRNLQHLKASIVALAVATLVLAIAAFYFAGRKANEAHLLATQAAQVSPPTTKPTSSPP